MSDELLDLSASSYGTVEENVMRVAGDRGAFFQRDPAVTARHRARVRDVDNFEK